MTLNRILAIDAAQRRALVSIVAGDQIIAERAGAPATGLADSLADWIAQCLTTANLAPGDFDAIAVTVGPGSFTGLRASIAAAQGFGLAAGITVHGVSMTEAFSATVPSCDRALWVALAARRGRVFLERDGVAAGYDEADLPRPEGPIALAGGEAGNVAARLAARGFDVKLTDARFCTGPGIATALRRHIAAGLKPRPPLPLYVDPPEARLPANGLRPAPR